MSIGDAVRALAGSPTWIAVRPTGIMLTMTDHQALRHLGRRGPHKWVPKFSDLVALDWQVLTQEQMAEMVKKQAAAVKAN
jgi:hypothetical protein